MRVVADRYVVMPKEKQRGGGVFTVVGEHREGGASRVVKAIDQQTADVVAVKLILRADTDDTHRVFFQREVEALERLTHPNIVSLLDHGEDETEDAFYLVFPWVDKRLRDVLPPPEDFGWDDFANTYGLALLDALAYAHERDVVHRDVKPTNILISDDQTPLLADFGISKIRSHLTEATVAEFVSRPYAPPELDGLGRASRDVWGFAATAAACLTGRTLTDYPHLDAALDEIDVPRRSRHCCGSAPTVIRRPAHVTRWRCANASKRSRTAATGSGCNRAWPNWTSGTMPFAQQRRECYAAFLIATSSYAQAVIPREPRDDKIVKSAEQELWSALAQILLLGNDKVKRAAEEYSKALTRVLDKGKTLENSESKRLREAFIAEARSDLPDRRRGWSSMSAGWVTRTDMYPLDRTILSKRFEMYLSRAQWRLRKIAPPAKLCSTPVAFATASTNSAWSAGLTTSCRWGES